MLSTPLTVRESCIDDVKPGNVMLTKAGVKVLDFGLAKQAAMMPLSGVSDAPTKQKFREWDPSFSPDGKWLAYTSNKSGRPEVYVRAFPGPGAKYQISTARGHSPAWARTGREVYYLKSDPTAGPYVHDFMAVDVSLSPDFSASPPRRLFGRQVSITVPVRNYDVGPDGRFLILTPYEPPTEKVTRLQVVLNWFEELKRLAPVEN